jgi:CubicO group peptidase (beta-lactamase class C family)
MYSKCFGTQSVDPDSPLLDTPLSIDTTMWVASCTKLMTAIAVLQCVERGLLDLDKDISIILSEWKSPDILLGFEDATGEPVLEKAKGKITLRMLLTHQSGMGYTFKDDKLKQFADYKKKMEGRNSRTLVCII